MVVIHVMSKNQQRRSRSGNKLSPRGEIKDLCFGNLRGVVDLASLHRSTPFTLIDVGVVDWRLSKRSTIFPMNCASRTAGLWAYKISIRSVVYIPLRWNHRLVASH